MSPSEPPQRFRCEALKEFAAKVFERLGVPPVDASQAADVLIQSDLRGIDSHGVARLPVYAEMLSIGRINPKPNIRVVRDKLSVARMDGDKGLGLVVGPRANELAMEKAARYGSGWVSVGNSSHFGIAGYYPLQALKRDLIGWAMTNASKLVAPVGAAQRMLGTNPIAIAFPGAEEPPVVIDLATSATSYGKVEIARRKGEPVPHGWIMSEAGTSTTNPDDLLTGGALMPLGSAKETGGHKGYALGAMVDLLCGALGGANWGPFVPPFAVQQPLPTSSVGAGVGHFFGAIQIEAFMDVQEFKSQIDHWVRVFRQTKGLPDMEGPLIPGDPERLAEAERSRSGIPLLAPVVQSLTELSQKTGVNLVSCI